MSLTLLQIFQDCANDLGFGAEPATVIGNTDQNIVQLLGMAQTLGPRLSRKYGWQEIEASFSFTSVAANSQGELTTIIATDYERLVPGTMWDNSTDMPIMPISAEEYERQLQTSVTAVYLQHYIAGDTLNFIPAPPAGRTITGRYISTGWCEDAGGTGQTRWADDTDVIRFDPTLYKLHLMTTWLQRKNLPYGEMQRDRDTYELNLQSQQTEGEIIDLTGDGYRKGGNPAAQIGGANWEDLATNWEELG